MSRCIHVPLGERAYPIHIAPGGLLRAAALLGTGDRPLAIVTEANLTAHLSALTAGLGREVPTLVLPADGEALKTLAVLERVLDFLASAGLDREGAVLAFGGGVIGDLAGFAAASYLRGVDLLQVPTTLLAQVDSAVGGKTGVNLAAGKNLAGAFWQPRAVLVDPLLLDSLPARERTSGLGEVVKYGLLGAPVVELLADGLPAGADRVALLAACLQHKADVVVADETEQGAADPRRSRATLNLGHTFGHALEAATGYAVFRHGEAVAHGLRFAVRLSQRVGRLREVDACLAPIDRLTLPPLPALAAEALWARLGQDKKRRAGRVRWVLLDGLGQPVPGVDVEDDVVHQLIEETLS